MWYLHQQTVTEQLMSTIFTKYFEYNNKIKENNKIFSTSPFLSLTSIYEGDKQKYVYVDTLRTNF